MAQYTLAGLAWGRLHRERRVTFDNTRVHWYYAVGQAVVSLVAFQAMPRLIG